MLGEHFTFTMVVLVVTQDLSLPLITTTILLVNGALANPVAKPFSFDMFENPDDFNDTLYEEIDNTRPPVWDQISNDLEKLVNNTKLDHKHSNSVNKANLKEIKDLLRRSSYNIENKLKIVETNTKHAVSAAKDKILYENNVMQNKFINKFQNLQSKLKNITESMQSGATNTVNTIRSLIDSGFKTMKDTLYLNFRSLSSLISNNVTMLTVPSSNESSQPLQHEPETKNLVTQSLKHLTAVIEGMTEDLWSIKYDIKNAKQNDKVTQNDQPTQTTKSPQRIQKTTNIPAVTTQEPEQTTIITQKPKTTEEPQTTLTSTEETTTVPNSLGGLFEDLPTVKTKKEEEIENSLSKLFEVTEKEQIEDNMFEGIFQQEGIQEIEGSGVHPRYKRSPIDFTGLIKDVKSITDFGRQIDLIWTSLMTLTKQQNTIKENIAINNKAPNGNGEQEELRPYDNAMVRVDVPFKKFEADKVLDRINKLNSTVFKIKNEQQMDYDEEENENKRQFNWKYITVTISILSFLSSLTYCLWACICSRYKLKKKEANRYPRYQYWNVKKDECEIDLPKPVPNHQTPIQPVHPVQYPRHQLIIEDPRLTLPNLHFMTTDAQQNQPQSPIEENPKTTYTDAKKR